MQCLSHIKNTNFTSLQHLVAWYFVSSVPHKGVIWNSWKHQYLPLLLLVSQCFLNGIFCVKLRILFLFNIVEKSQRFLYFMGMKLVDRTSDRILSFWGWKWPTICRAFSVNISNWISKFSRDDAIVSLRPTALISTTTWPGHSLLRI